MGRPLVQQINHPHPEADKTCEGCHGSGWLTALVDSEEVLRDARRRNPCDFVFKCDECEVYENDAQAANAAEKAGLKVDLHGAVKYRKSDFAPETQDAN